MNYQWEGGENAHCIIIIVDGLSTLRRFESKRIRLPQYRMYSHNYYVNYCYCHNETFSLYRRAIQNNIM